MKQQIEASYKQLIKEGKTEEFLNQAVIELMEKPEIIKDYEGDTTKALKALTKTVAQRIKWQKRQEIQRFILFEAEKTDEKGNAVKLEIADNSAVYDIERIEMIQHVINLLSKDEAKQKIFCLYYIENQTVREIAETLNLSKSDVDRKLKSVANTIDKANIRRLYADIYISATERPAGLDKCRCKQQHDISPAFDRLIDITDNDAMEALKAEKEAAQKATRKAVKKATRAAYRHVSSNALLDRDWYSNNIRYVEDYQAFTEFGQSHITRRPQASNDGTMMMMQKQDNPINFVLVNKA